ncbi:RWP-RK domain-containing (ISS) [Micractinium conductrix]|uniref:RWP-RK domain-containing (ISS) n=1 Tax=Micractinium conductrix TaxID=554055 RepID=A0A2P6VJV8_9CHLO|nr:RWP-RK domain-containing (ISS) [Micractinium conductrix]|eukprot:PSC74358.1 RWP-RK domain-containing (ISS) [Micractinium conductrix]
MASPRQRAPVVWAMRMFVLLNLMSSVGFIVYALILENPPATALPLGMLIVGIIGLVSVPFGVLGSMRGNCCLSLYLFMGVLLTLAELGMTLSLFFNYEHTVDDIWKHARAKENADGDADKFTNADKEALKSKVSNGRWYFLVVCCLQFVGVIATLLLKYCGKQREFESFEDNPEAGPQPSSAQIQLQKLKESVSGRALNGSMAHTSPSTSSYASSKLNKSITQKMAAKYGDFTSEFKQKGAPAGPLGTPTTMQAANSPRQRTKKRTKAGILVSSITYADVEACFALPTEKACVKLGVGLTILKRLCRKFGIQRWPYRSLLKAGKAQRVPNTPTFSDSVPCSPVGAPAAPSCATPGSGDIKSERILMQAAASSLTSHCGTASEGSSRPDSAAPSSTAPVEQHSPLRAAAFASAAAAPPAVRTAVAAARASPLVQPLAQPPKASQLGVLLSAIDAFEAPAAPAAHPSTPHDSAGCAPFTPHASAGRGLAAPPAGAAPHRRAFTHSSRSGFQPLRQPVQQRQAYPAQLLARLAALQSMQVEVTALAPPPPMPDAAARMLRSQLASHSMTEGQRLALAEKLLMVRAALQARMARRAALAAAAGGRYSPYPAAPLSTYSPASSGPVPIASLPVNSSGESVSACGMSIADLHSLANARSLLAQYRL